MLIKKRTVSAPQVLKWKHPEAHSLQKGGSPENSVQVPKICPRTLAPNPVVSKRKLGFGFTKSVLHIGRQAFLSQMFVSQECSFFRESLLSIKVLVCMVVHKVTIEWLIEVAFLSKKNKETSGYVMQFQ